MLNMGLIYEEGGGRGCLLQLSAVRRGEGIDLAAGAGKSMHFQ